MSALTYGLSDRDLLSAKRKIEKQKNYLESNKIIGEEGVIKSFLDVSYSANISQRYYPRILNKVDTFVSTSLNQGLVPIFLTVTADGFFRDMLKGDYSRWTKKTKEKYERHIPNNDRSGHYYDYMNNHNILTPKDVYKIIGHQLHSFYKCETLRKIKKDGFTYTSIRVTEPHKDGVPHFHILMYVPAEYIPRMYIEFQRFFPAPRNHKRLTYKNTQGANKRNGSKIGENMYETFGFQTEVRSAAGYILKYILKSFKNLIDGEELDFLQAWYIHNKIPRIITTHTLVSQEIYHKVSMLEEDWYYLTDIKISGGHTKDTLNDYFKFEDGLGRKIIGDGGLFVLENNGKIISTYGSKKHFIKKIRLRSLSFSSVKPNDFQILTRFEIWTPPRPYSYYIKNSSKVDNSCVWISSKDDVLFLADHQYRDNQYKMVNGKKEYYLTIEDRLLLGIEKIITFKDRPSIVNMSDQSLFYEYQYFNFDVDAPARYAMIHNEMIDRGILHSHYVNPNDYNTGFYDD